MGGHDTDSNKKLNLPGSVDALIPPLFIRASEARAHDSFSFFMSIWYQIMASVIKLPMELNTVSAVFKSGSDCSKHRYRIEVVSRGFIISYSTHKSNVFNMFIDNLSIRHHSCHGNIFITSSV